MKKSIFFCCYVEYIINEHIDLSLNHHWYSFKRNKRLVDRIVFKYNIIYTYTKNY